MSADTITAGAHTVVASVMDPSGNVGTATQTLTLDPLAPGVTVDGVPPGHVRRDAHHLRHHDEPGTPTVTVTVGGQTLTTTATGAGAWTVEVPTALDETSYGVVASVTDAASNTGSASQVLTVDVTVPVLTIDGGPSRFTNDTSPWTYGTTAEQAGSIVNLTLGGQSLTATVKPGGTWGVSAQELPSATYAVVATITDAAGNTGTMTQTLQIGDNVTMAVVSIDGGQTMSTNDTTPTISGLSSAPAATAVNVTVAGQNLLGTVGAGGQWSVTATALGQGLHPVAASVNFDGITSTARQNLTVDVTTPVLTINGGPIRFTADLALDLRHDQRASGHDRDPHRGRPVPHDDRAARRSVGCWADTLADGTYTVVATITDAAQNTGPATQSLQVGGTFTNPAIAIDGGTTEDSNDATRPSRGSRTLPPTPRSASNSPARP